MKEQILAQVKGSLLSVIIAGSGLAVIDLTALNEWVKLGIGVMTIIALMLRCWHSVVDIRRGKAPREEG